MTLVLDQRLDRTKERIVKLVGDRQIEQLVSGVSRLVAPEWHGGATICTGLRALRCDNLIALCPL
jgi:hypothetical protein